MAKLPVSVVIPHQPHRAKFFKKVVLPSIEANEPAEIIIKTFESLSAQKKRNAGAAESTQPYLIFVDDDVELKPYCLSRMLATLEQVGPEIGFAYCDYEIVCHGQWQHPSAPIFKSQEFVGQFLKEGNYISGISLMRREVFPGWDENLRRLQDWDLWLSVTKKGCSGEYIPEPLFTAHYFDDGISVKESMREADLYVRKKHGI